MTLGNTLDAGLIIILNMISAYACYRHYYPDGYDVSKKKKNRTLKTKKAFLLRWSRILLSASLGFVHMGYAFSMYAKKHIVAFKNLPWD